VSLLRALFAHELSHVRHRDPLLKRVLAGTLVPLATLAAAVSAGLIEGADGAAGPLGISVALLASATLLPWAYACLQAVSFAMELRADREAAGLLGGPSGVFDLLDCLDDGGQPYRLRGSAPSRPPELVEREANRLLEELLYLLPSHPPTWERRKRAVALGRKAAREHFWRDALPGLLGGTAPLAVALALGVLALELVGPTRLRPIRLREPALAQLAPDGSPPSVRHIDAACRTTRDAFCEARLRGSIAAALAEAAPTARRPPRRPRK
jgi:hypothetical protein